MAKGAHEQASITLKLFYVIAISFFMSNCQAMKLPFISNYLTCKGVKSFHGSLTKTLINVFV